MLIWFLLNCSENRIESPEAQERIDVMYGLGAHLGCGIANMSRRPEPTEYDKSDGCLFAADQYGVYEVCFGITVYSECRLFCSDPQASEAKST